MRTNNNSKRASALSSMEIDFTPLPCDEQGDTTHTLTEHHGNTIEEHAMENYIAPSTPQVDRLETRYFKRIRWLQLAFVIIFLCLSGVLCFWYVGIVPCETTDQLRVMFNMPSVYDVEPLDYDEDFFVSPFPRTSNNQSIARDTFRVVFLGDSLINKPMALHLRSYILRHLLTILEDFSLPLEMYNCAHDGTGVADLRKSPLNSCTLPLYPDAVILFWHTDVSDNPYATGRGIALGDLTLSNYISNTTALLTSLTENVPYVAISSQGVLNEGWGLFGPHPPHYKDAALDYYSDVNRDMARTFGIRYIDIRDALKSATPPTQLFYRRCNTQDGEHPNVRGTKVVAKLFADVIRTWLSPR